MRHFISFIRFGLTALLAGALGSPAHAVIFVDLSATGANNGSSWTNAFNGLNAVQDAINAAAPGSQEVWIADGIYQGFFTLSSGVKLYGGFHGNPGGETLLSQRNPAANVSILQGTGFFAAGTVLTLPGVTGCIVDGLTIQGGTGTLTGGTLVAGGGITCNGANNTNAITNCIISNDIYYQTQQITPITVTGAGIYLVSSSPAITNCQFIGNTITFYLDPGITLVTVRGGALEIQNGSSPIVSNCVFQSNRIDVFHNIPAASPFVTVAGGAIDVQGPTSAPRFTNCLIVDNAVTADFGDQQFVGGGAVMLDGVPSTVSFTNCTISDNFCSGETISLPGLVTGGIGPAMLLRGTGSVGIRNCIIAYNTSSAVFPAEGRAIHEFDMSSDPVLTNCLFFGNPRGDYNNEGDSDGSGTALSGGAALNALPGNAGNIGGATTNPLFVDKSSPGFDYRLYVGSAAANVATSVGAPAADIVGNPRPFGPGYDIGAYEGEVTPPFTPTPSPTGSPTPTTTPSPTPSASSTASPSATPTPTSTATPTPSATPTVSSTPSASPTPSSTPTPFVNSVRDWESFE